MPSGQPANSRMTPLVRFPVHKERRRVLWREDRWCVPSLWCMVDDNRPGAFKGFPRETTSEEEEREKEGFLKKNPTVYVSMAAS